MRVFHYTIENKDPWAIAHQEIIVVASDKNSAKSKLKEKGFSNIIAKDLFELKEGVHVIQEKVTE